MSREARQSPLISCSVSCTCFPGRPLRAPTSLSIMSSSLASSILTPQVSPATLGSLAHCLICVGTGPQAVSYTAAQAAQPGTLFICHPHTPMDTPTRSPR
eukprot:scaffold2128_cov371-Prasinococcus_capsulatus_cf.AAC.5